jgi:hypothetical protein
VPRERLKKAIKASGEKTKNEAIEAGLFGSQNNISIPDRL